jgi:predicted Fe-Mo cluster-binding NifX family protein
MTKEQGRLLQADFIALCEKYGLKSSSAFFVDVDGTSGLAFNEIGDNDLMFFIANLVVRIAAKHNMTVDEVLSALRNGIKEEAITC